jgi:hypothetical protein
MLTSHVNNIEALIQHALKNVESQRVVEILNERITSLAETQILKRDIDNFVSYFIYVLSGPVLPKKLTLDVKLVRHFIKRTYAGFDKESQELQTRKIYNHIKKTIGENVEINGKNLGALRNSLKEEEFTFEKLKERIIIGLLLKWLQGPLKEKLSESLNDYIVFLATTFGQFVSDRIINFEVEDYRMGQKDLAILTLEYTFFETALLDALMIIRKFQSKLSKNASVRDQFRFVFKSLDNLIVSIQSETKDELTIFRDKMIVSISLIYLQDSFVRKEPEVENLINLFLSLYYQFRDKRLKPN